MPRTLITNRRLPAAVPLWSGWATMLGLHNAAPSMAYSLVNVAPSNNIRASESSLSGIQAIGEFTGVPAEGADQIAVTPVEAGDDVVQRRPHLVLVESQDALQHRSRAGVLVLEAFLPGYEQPGDDPRRVGRDAAAGCA